MWHEIEWGPSVALAEGVPANVGEHGAPHDESRNEEGGKNASPEAHAAERNEEDALLASEVNARLVGQEGFDGDCDQKTCGPDEGDSERELQGKVHH